ncbi:hypothetical protein SK128_027182 [Halocaridina rubra]|uniref:Uncharacterized protein n=1 Tax=Halocaridina rubra TaxID=373956 RepID=A0AAN8XFU4_HALRR
MECIRLVFVDGSWVVLDVSGEPFFGVEKIAVLRIEVIAQVTKGSLFLVVMAYEGQGAWATTSTRSRLTCRRHPHIRPRPARPPPTPKVTAIKRVGGLRVVESGPAWRGWPGSLIQQCSQCGCSPFLNTRLLSLAPTLPPAAHPSFRQSAGRVTPAHQPQRGCMWRILAQPHFGLLCHMSYMCPTSGNSDQSCQPSVQAAGRRRAPCS